VPPLLFGVPLHHLHDPADRMAVVVLGSRRLADRETPALLAELPPVTRHTLPVAFQCGGEGSGSGPISRPGPCRGQALGVMAIFLGWASDFLGMVMVTTPLALAALTFSASAPGGSWMAR